MFVNLTKKDVGKQHIKSVLASTRIWKGREPDLVSIAVISRRTFPYWDYGHDSEAVSYDV